MPLSPSKCEIRSNPRATPGDAYDTPPGHDDWVIGDKRYVAIDFTGVAKYAKPA
jgi:hypothetical protein